MPGDVNWDVDEFHLKDTNLTRLPDSPVCRVLVKLFLQDTDLTIIPPTFFEHMPVLEVLDLSNTNIVSLPTSISNLSRLQELLLRDCSSLMELPTEIGMLSNLKLFDINGTELMFIPEEMGKLKDLEVLRICLSQYAKHYIETDSVNEKVIPRKMISELKRLKELCVSISVGSEPEWWEEEVKDLQHELCDLVNLQTLRWYLPTSDVLQQFLLLKSTHGPIYKRISNLMLTIGQHAQITSCLPQGLERKFEEFKNCLKWINEEGNVNDISEIIPKAEALFLSRHWSIKKLSTYNITTLKYCLLAECNEMETLVEADGLFEDGKTRIENSEKNGLELLQYLSIHHMKKLQSIWMGPIGKGSLSKLRILALHTCYQLTSIFTLTIAQNLSCLVEITVEDCPNVITLISGESHNVKYVPLFPSLQKIFLLDLPELVNIFVDDIMLNNLRTMLIYKCPQLRDLSNMDLPYIKKIEGQTEWWNCLGSDKSRWESFFVPLKKRRDLVEQLYKATNSLAHFHDVISEDQMIPAGTSMEKGKGEFIPPQETENKESDSFSRFEAPDTEPEDFNSLGVSNSEARPLGFSGPKAVSIGEVDSLSLSRQENDARESSDLTDVMEQEVVVDTSMQKEKGNLLPSEDNEKKSSNLTDVIDQMIPADTSTETGKGVFIPPQETENKGSDCLSRFEAPDTEPEDFNSLGVSTSEARPLGFSGPKAVSIGEVDSLSLSRQERMNHPSASSGHAIPVNQQQQQQQNHTIISIPSQPVSPPNRPHSDLLLAENMNNTGAASGPAIPLVPPISHKHQQQLDHTIVPIVTPPVSPPPPAPPLPNLPRSDLLDGSRVDYINIGVRLYEAAIKGDWRAAKPILDKRPDVIRFAITENYETLLHVAASAESTKAVEEFVTNLVNLMDKKDLELQNTNCSTALSLAAAAGNVKTAMIMVKNNPDVAEIPGNNRMMPLYMAALFAKPEMARYLYDISKKMGGDYWSHDNRGWVLQKCVESDIFDLALKIVGDHPELLVKKGLLTDVLLALAQKPKAFEGKKLHVVFRIIKSIFGVFHVKVGPDEKESEALQLLKIIWGNMAKMTKTEVNDIIRGPPLREGRTIKGYPSRVLFVAAKLGNTRFIVELIRSYPDLIWKVDDKGKTIFHLAVKRRQEKIYNLLYEIGAMKDLITPIKDKKGNNMLHMVSKSAKQSRFQNVSGVAFQMQRELLWFKEVEQMIPPSYRQRKNGDNETPQDLFTKKHEKLVTKGEDWMKNTASQCMVVATLITTIVFVAAFALPGGYDQDTGIPFFRKEPALIIFVIADTVSLISSSTSVLMFLAILTSRYAERDFLESLPRKLLFGLAMLFLSIVTMMIAFSASFFVVYDKKVKWVPITITGLAGMPVILFAILQFRLLGDVFYSTYRSRYLFKPKKRILYF
ncbi:putative ankyrin repeat-containing domain, PGG domain, leucine-rich repeat domain superfamily [Helianthus debilis subsp. tardiflorus]